MRTIKARQVKPSRTVSTRVATINLRAYPQDNPVTTPTPALVAGGMFGGTREANTTTRQRFGRSLTMERIEVALRAAFSGSMTSITDILHETVDTDPHLGSILNKRFGSLAALPYQVQPATGYGIDRAKAMFYAEVVRAQLRSMKSFRRNLAQLAWALFNGRACLEKTWVQLDPGTGPVDPKYGQPFLAVSDMEWIHPRRLSFGSQRQLIIQPDRPVMSGNFDKGQGLSVLDMPDKFVWWLPQLFNEYPEREGLGLRCMYWSFFKRFAARERMVLTELYGKPWRIAEVDPDANVSLEDLQAADAIIDNLGATHTARLPRGIKLTVESPGKSAGDVHSDIISDSDSQNSKLVLGQTGTTDSVPAGMNNSQANVMQDEQLGVLIRDAGMLSEVVETLLCDRMIAINFGEAEVTHAPTFMLRADLPADRKAEIDRLTAALSAGLTIDRTEAYEVSGFSMPEPGAVVLRIEQPPTPPNSPVAPATRPVFVFPVGQTPDVGEQQLPPPVAGFEEGGDQLANAAVSQAEAHNTVTVNEDRQARGLDALKLPDGTDDPRGGLTIAEFNAQITQQYASGAAPVPGAPTPGDDPEPAPGDDPAAVVVPKPGDLSSVLNTRKVTAVYDVNEDVEYETPFGDGGVHQHVLRRQLEATSLDGHHYHVFKVAGSYVLTQMDGAHGHMLATVDAASTMLDGEHQHAVVMPNGMTLLTTETGSDHIHELQVASTAVDGSHTHTLMLQDSSNPAGYSEYLSMTSSQLAADIAAGLVPDALFAAIDQMSTTSVLPVMVQAAAKVKRFEAVYAAANLNLAEQPASADGSPDQLRGLREMQAETSLWATTFQDAVQSETSTFGIYNALIKARQQLSIAKFGRALERAKLQAMMLGAMDSVRELAGLDDTAKATEAGVSAAVDEATDLGSALISAGITRKTLATLVLGGPKAKTPFATMPFKQAVDTFKSLNVLDKVSYERASAAVKQRSFTVAGIVGDQMLHTLQSDLFDALKTGEDLNAFKKRIRSSLQDSGYVAQVGELKTGQQALNASHIETVFRTNTLNTYNTGRYIHQSSPAVQQAFPVWQIVAVKDTRTRETHANASGKMLLANDPFWKTAYPPFGWNCRCRVTPRTKKALNEVVSGSTILGLPDTGFTSGRTALATG